MSLLERDQERAAIAAVLKGPGGCVLVSGPDGIGKTALLDEARELASTRVLSARGSELERWFAFGGVQQLFGRVPIPKDGAAAHAAAAFSLAGKPDQAVLHGLYWLTAGLGPLTIVVDDAHWLDRQSLRWLASMVNRVADLPLALILAARDDEPLAPIARHPATRVLTPQPLTADAIATLAGDERAAAIAEATGGNPFHVHALLADAGGTPRPVIDSIALRPERLPAACTALARAIAVTGASGTIAAQLAGLDVRGAVEAAGALTAADILRGDDFAHPLVRQAVYAAIPTGQRAELHAAAARLVTGPDRIAAQVLAAGPGGGVWAVQALRAAARAAWARGAPDVAATLLRRAAEEELPRDELVPLLRELARALIAVEGPGGLPALREALALARGPEREAIVLELGRSLFAQGHFTDAAAVFEQGTSVEAKTELATVAVLDLALVRRFGGLDAIAAEAPGTAVAAAIAVARTPAAAGGAERVPPSPRAGGAERVPPSSRATDNGEPAPPSSRAGGAERVPPSPRASGAESVPPSSRATDNGERVPPSPRAGGAEPAPPPSHAADDAEAALVSAPQSSRAAALVALMAAGRLERADAIWTAVADAARVSGALDTLRLAVALRAPVRLRQGRIAETEADLRELIAWTGELQHDDGRVALPWVIAPLVDALIERGEVDEAQSWVTGLESDWPEVLGFTFLLDSLARLRLAQGRVTEALVLARECASRQRAWGIRNPGFLAWGSTLAAALAATGRIEEALDCCDEQAAFARRFGATREHGMALLALGRITGEAATLREAVDVLAPSPARLEYARALVALGDRDGLRSALELAERRGATALAAQARDLLGMEPAAPAPTASQERIARLAASGLGNREIAERLCVTERTVEAALRTDPRRAA